MYVRWVDENQKILDRFRRKGQREKNSLRIELNCNTLYRGKKNKNGLVWMVIDDGTRKKMYHHFFFFQVVQEIK